MEPVGFGNLSGTLGESSDQDSHGKSRRHQTSAEGPLRAPHVKNFCYLSLPVCYHGRYCGCSSNARGCCDRAFHLLFSRKCNYVPKIPSESRVLFYSCISCTEPGYRTVLKFM